MLRGSVNRMNVGKLFPFREQLAILVFIGALCFFSFAFRIIAIRFQVFPYSILNRDFDELRQLATDPLSDKYLQPLRYDESGAKIHNMDRIMPGATL